MVSRAMQRSDGSHHRDVMSRLLLSEGSVHGTMALQVHRFGFERVDRYTRASPKPAWFPLLPVLALGSEKDGRRILRI